MAILGALNLLLKADDSQFQRTLKGAGAALDRESKRWDKLGNRLSVGLTAPLLGVATGAFYAAEKFQSATQQMRADLDLTTGELETMRKGVRQLAGSIPDTAIELGKLATAAGGMGVAKENVLAFVRVAAGLGHTTDMAAAEAETAMKKFSDAYKLPITDAERLAGALQVLDKESTATAGGILASATSMAAVGTQLGLTAPEVLGLAAAFATAGIDAEKGGTMFSKLALKVSAAVEAGGAKLNAFAHVAGMSAKDFADLWAQKPVEAVLALLSGLQNLGANSGGALALLDDVGASGGKMAENVLKASGAVDTIRKLMGLSSETWKQNTAFVEHTSEAYGTAENKLKLLRNATVDAGIALGQNLLSVVGSVAGGLQKVAEWVARLADGFSQLPTGVKAVYAALILLTMLVGPIAKLVAQAIALTRALLACRLASGDWTAVIQVGLIVALLSATAGVAALASGVDTLNGKMKTTAQRAREAADQMRETYGTPTFTFEGGKWRFGPVKETPYHPEPGTTNPLTDPEKAAKEAEEAWQAANEAIELSLDRALWAGENSFATYLDNVRKNLKEKAPTLDELLSFKGEKPVVETQLEGVGKELERVTQQAYEFGAAVASSVFQPLTDAIIDMFEGAKIEWGKLAKRILADLARIVVEMAFLNPMENAVGGWFARLATGTQGTGGTPYEAGPTITIYDQRSTASGPAIETKTKTGAGGQRVIELYVRDHVRGTVANGELDDVMAQRFGLTALRSF